MRPEQQMLIGKDVVVIASPNALWKGLSGRITDETKNTLTIGGKVLPKSEVTLRVDGVIIQGKTIMRTLTERIKVHKQ